MLHNITVWRKYWLMGVIIVVEFGKCACDFEYCYGGNMTKERCSQTTINGIPCTNCSSPFINNAQCEIWDYTDLDPTMKCLYSYNIIANGISSNTFKKYPELTHFWFLRGALDYKYPKDTLEPLKKLQYFNLTLTNWFENTEITLPSSLRILDMTKFPVNTLVALNLDFLEVLNVSQTKITEFPTLSEIAPLKLIVLDQTTLTNFKIEDLARLCKLQSISMKGTSLGNDNCKCLVLKAWTEKYNVKIINEISCQADTKCSLDFTETTLKNRNECLAKQPFQTWYLLIFALVGLLLLILCGCGFLYTWLIKKEEEEGILGLSDEDLEHMAPHPHHTTEPAEVGDEESAEEDGADVEEAEDE